jgi:hypothetical protein|tara:strand:- start:765 stop:1082 length:318 start_codon:yes stop_codon:yes gene_type:complete
MTKAGYQEFYERHSNRNERIRREFWRGAEDLNRGSRRKLVLHLAHMYRLHPSGINKIVVHKPTGRMLREDLLKELLPGLDALFSSEYAKYGEEHKRFLKEIVNDV